MYVKLQITYANFLEQCLPNEKVQYTLAIIDII
jgi:hypothetical protein